MITCAKCGCLFYCPTRYFRYCWTCEIKLNPLREIKP